MEQHDINSPHSNPSHFIDEIVLEEIMDKIRQTALIVSNDGDIIFANTEFLKLYGLTRSQAAGHKVYDSKLGITDLPHFTETLKQAMANGGRLTYERTFVRDFQPHYSETTIIHFVNEGQDRFLYLAKDITDLRLSQLQAEELNQMLKKIIDNLPVYLFVKDVDDGLRYLIWNKAFAEYSKIPAEKVIGRTDFEVFPDFKDAQQFRDDDLKVIRKGEMSRKHETYMAADGNTRIVQTYKTLVTRQGQGPLLVGISLDITDIQGIENELIHERKRAEESDRLKTRFLANMSHEIRTPLNAIVGFSGMIADAEDDETREKFLQIISENSELLLQIINDILDISKIEAGTLEYTRMPMDLFDTFRDLYLIYKNKPHSDVTLFFDNESTPCTFIINEDRNRILQVMENLLTNAAKFTVKGEIHYGFTVKGDWIEVYVNDTGKGIPQEMQSKVFDRFVKLDNYVQGTGLGLSICKLIVETLGGSISLQSQEGKGSRFSFTIPYVKDKKFRLTSGKTKPSTIHTNHSPEKNDLSILVAEDVYSNFLVVKALIKGRYNILWAKDGLEAVEIARKEKPDLILMDIKMPNMNGLVATREIRKFDDDGPIVAMTANVFDNDRSIAQLAGMDNFISKPINREAFEAILRAYLSSHS